MTSENRPLYGTGLEDELVLEYDVEEYPWKEIVSEILQVFNTLLPFMTMGIDYPHRLAALH